MRRLLAPFAALLTALSVHAAPPPAGEIALTLPYPQAQPRGPAGLRVLAWYPAAADAGEAEVMAGPVFAAGRVARDAAWQDATRRPLVLLSHGFGGAARQMTWLGEALARAGYVAVAIDHPGTNGIDGITPVGAYAPWLRAADLSRLLDGVLADPVLGAHVDRERIGVAGFSIGGWTAALLLGATADFERFRAFCRGPARDAICNEQVEYPLNYERQHAELKAAGAEGLLDGERHSWRDARVKAGLLIAPALVQALAPESLARIAVPVRLVAGDADPVVPTPSNAGVLAREIPGARLDVLAGVGHYDFLSPCTPAGRQMAPALCAEPGPPRAQTHAAAVRVTLDFFAATLR